MIYLILYVIKICQRKNEELLQTAINNLKQNLNAMLVLMRLMLIRLLLIRLLLVRLLLEEINKTLDNLEKLFKEDSDSLFNCNKNIKIYEDYQKLLNDKNHPYYDNDYKDKIEKFQNKMWDQAEDEKIHDKLDKLNELIKNKIDEPEGEAANEAAGKEAGTVSIGGGNNKSNIKTYMLIAVLICVIGYLHFYKKNKIKGGSKTSIEETKDKKKSAIYFQIGLIAGIIVVVCMIKFSFIFDDDTLHKFTKELFYHII